MPLLLPPSIAPPSYPRPRKAAESRLTTILFNCSPACSIDDRLSIYSPCRRRHQSPNVRRHSAIGFLRTIFRSLADCRRLLFNHQIHSTTVLFARTITLKLLYFFGVLHSLVLGLGNSHSPRKADAMKFDLRSSPQSPDITISFTTWV